ncbi:ParA family protein [Halotia branconii]|uniref:ParA family protein n=1 Tax=Halotia branconii CENA392 TaxID=1539056 RepID=A0AAJ6NYH0_9CYAN|nr:ParA family protein [Halotia branconii]WGV29080.1 ParA family protein [Halotia branconii CENA392]
MTPIIALFNQSGGVGKTTLTMNLGYHLAQMGRKVLLVDIDPQSSLTTFMGLESMELESTIYNAIVHQDKIPIIHDLHSMDLVPSNIKLSKAEMELSAAIMRELRLKQSLETIQEQYDYILIDCPPSLGILSIMSLVAATHVLIPIQTEFKALKGTELLLNTIVEVLNVANRKLKVAGIIPTMYDARTSQGEQSLQSIQTQLSKVGIVHTTIPRATDFANASQARKPLAVFNPKHPTLKLLKEISKTLDSLK